MNWDPLSLLDVSLTSNTVKDLFQSTGTDPSRIFAYEPQPDDMITFHPPSELEEIDRYWVNEPYAFISILFSDDESAALYHVIEPELTEFEHQLLGFILEDLRDVLIYSDQRWERAGDEEERSTSEIVFQEAMIDLLDQYGLGIQPESFYRVYYYVWRTFRGFGKLDPIMRDPFIEDISCDGNGIPIYIYHEEYQNIAANVSYEEAELDSFVIRLSQEAGKNISLEKPYVSGTLTDGSRIELTFGKEVTRHGSTFTIRKFAEEPYTPIDLINFGTFSIEQMAYLRLAIENNKSLIFAGGTASVCNLGKISSVL